MVQLEQRAGEYVVDERDATALMDELKQAGDRVRVLEMALAVAIQKDEAAQAELNNAKRQVAIDAVAAAETRLNAHGPEGEALFTAMTQFAIAVARDQETVRLARLASGSARHGVDVAEILRQFELFAGRAGHPLTGAGLLPARLMRFPSWSACLKAVCAVKEPEG